MVSDYDSDGLRRHDLVAAGTGETPAAGKKGRARSHSIYPPPRPALPQTESLAGNYRLGHSSPWRSTCMVRSSGPIQSSGSIYKRGHDKTLHCTWEMVRYTFNTTPTLLGGQKPGKNGVYSGRGLGAGDRTCQQGRQTGPLERTESLSELRNGCAWRSDAMGSEGKCRDRCSPRRSGGCGRKRGCSRRWDGGPDVTPPPPPRDSATLWAGAVPAHLWGRGGLPRPPHATVRMAAPLARLAVTGIWFAASHACPSAVLVMSVLLKRGAWVPTPYGNMSLMPWGVKEATASLFVVSHACPSAVHVMSVLLNISGKAG